MHVPIQMLILVEAELVARTSWGATSAIVLYRVVGEGGRTITATKATTNPIKSLSYKRISDDLSSNVNLSYIMERIRDQRKRMCIKSGFATRLEQLVIWITKNDAPMSSATKNENEMAIVASKRCLRLIRIAILLQEKEFYPLLLSRRRILMGML